MFLIILLCSVPGSLSYTFNGNDSKATLQLNNVTTDQVLSFSLQTRRQESFLFAAYESATRYFVVGIKDGMLSLHANYSGEVITIKGGGAVSDGSRHKITIQSSNSNTTVTNDNKTEIFTKNILNADWLKLLSNRVLTIGRDDTPLIRNLFNKAYFGALSLHRIGDQLPLEGDNYTLTNVISAWRSSEPCKEKPCQNNGTCRDIFNAYLCDCTHFYTKQLCNETVNVSCSFPMPLCSNGGKCITLNQTTLNATPVAKQFSDNGRDLFKCQCARGYGGHQCKNESIECLPNPCKNGAVCSDLHLDYNCQCTDGWEGKNCTADIDNCYRNPCKNNGSCSDLLNDYNCTCADGRYSGKNCSDDVNECNQGNPCKRGSCTNTIGSYDCSCDHGYYGKNCQYNNTEYCNIPSACKRGNCVINGSIYYCQCDRGYTGDRCDQDFNECEVYKPCKNNASCTDRAFQPGYICNCTSQFQGVNCSVEKDPCSNPDACLNGGNCTKIDYQTHNCSCPPRWRGDSCGVLAAVRRSGDDDWVVIVVAVVVVLVIIIIAIFLLICYVRKNSGQQGTYKPNLEENVVGAVAMDTIKKPNVERLI